MACLAAVVLGSDSLAPMTADFGPLSDLGAAARMQDCGFVISGDKP